MAYISWLDRRVNDHKITSSILVLGITLLCLQIKFKFNLVARTLSGEEDKEKYLLHNGIYFYQNIKINMILAVSSKVDLDNTIALC